MSVRALSIVSFICAEAELSSTAYPASFDDDYDESDIFDTTEPKLSRPLSVAGSPRGRSGMMTPGDFASLQEGREGLSTEDYIAWKLPWVSIPYFRYSVERATSHIEPITANSALCREEEDPDDYAFPLTLRSPASKTLPAASPMQATINGGR